MGICLTLLMLQTKMGYAQSMQQIMERNWQGLTVEYRGAFKGFMFRLNLIKVSYNEDNGRFKATMQKTLSSKQGTFYDVSEYSGEFNPPQQITFNHSRVVQQDKLPNDLIWPNEYFSATLSTDPSHKGHYILMDDGYVRKIVFTTYPYANK